MSDVTAEQARAFLAELQGMIDRMVASGWKSSAVGMLLLGRGALIAKKSGARMDDALRDIVELWERLR